MNTDICYTKCNIYGIKIYNYIEKYIILYEQKYDKIMSHEMIQEAKLFYEKLDENNKKNIKFQIYTKCESIDNKENCMIWWNISLNDFIKQFNI